MVLIVLFFKSGDKVEEFRFSIECREQPCVRFCCDNCTLCNIGFINDNFNKSLIPVYDEDDWNISQPLKTFYGEPKCSKSINGLVEFEKNKEWIFYSVMKYNHSIWK